MKAKSKSDYWVIWEAPIYKRNSSETRARGKRWKMERNILQQKSSTEVQSRKNLWKTLQDCINTPIIKKDKGKEQSLKEYDTPYYGMEMS